MPRNKEFDYDEKLVTARDLFWKKGYNATTMNDLVDTMQINRSSLYLAYGNKHDLFLKSLTNYIQNKDKQYSQAAKNSEKPLEAIRNVIYSVMESALRDTNCLFTNSVFELATTDQEVSEMLKKQTLKAVDLFEKLLTQAKEDGSLLSAKEPRALAHFLTSGLVSIYNTHILFADAKLTKQTTEFLIGSINQ
ncbi:MULTISPECIES: TetR/AcrR family transcriptional regulator [Olivibacter]|uniref:TetR/AcrR family transcriptional regulator n=2 Tax=Olivibacter TaxID=376469 RepID=A0ABV6HM18_9SPHI|nr:MULTISPECIES: TetR/AcrR family transcriptional regulator [Olivibacter]MCL4640361.1 TetR/AcrR family transcriptional regulator [Olivibacter sp. UJ_SKK_5.1]MDX3917380.1 TetR/AcrR family transcriptional regulator [Pseudosphingobacterium sp.]QEL02686.1 TetR/AcrR family transcriptional regulator [Olivibacter sp. LS-1]